MPGRQKRAFDWQRHLAGRNLRAADDEALRAQVNYRFEYTSTGPSAPASVCANTRHSIKRPAFIVRNSAAICSPQLPPEFFQATRHSTALASPPAARITFSSDYSLMAVSKNFSQKLSPLFGARTSSRPFQTITASGSNSPQLDQATGAGARTPLASQSIPLRPSSPLQGIFSRSSNENGCRVKQYLHKRNHDLRSTENRLAT